MYYRNGYFRGLSKGEKNLVQKAAKLNEAVTGRAITIPESQEAAGGSGQRAPRSLGGSSEETETREKLKWHQARSNVRVLDS